MPFSWAGAAGGAQGALRQQQQDALAAAQQQAQLEEMLALRHYRNQQVEAEKQRMDFARQQFDVQQQQRQREESEASNARGMRQMIGTFVQAKGGQPLSAGDRQTLLGMGVMEGLELPRQLTEEPTQPTGDTQWVQGPEGITFRVPKAGDQPYQQPSASSAPNVGSFEDYVLRRYGQTPTAQQITQARKDYMQADDRPGTNLIMPGGLLSPTQEANVSNRLITQWRTASAPAVELDRQVKLMDVGLTAARRGDMAQGAQTILVTFQKILDPPSVVRESEYMRSAAGQALVSRVRGFAEQLAIGGAGIPLPELEKFAQLAREAAQAQASGYLDSVKRRIGVTADRYRIPREIIFEDFDLSPGAAPETPPPGQPPPPAPGAAPAAPPAAPRRLRFNPQTGRPE